MRYVVKVRASENQEVTYLWGGDGITQPFLGNSPLLMTFRVDEMGEPITIITSPPSTIGILQPGETYTIPLNGLTGVSAQCIPTNCDTKVECYIESLMKSD